MSYSHEWGVQNHFYVRPRGAWGEVKRLNIIKFQLQSQFQRILYQTLCVFSQIKDINQIEYDFHSVADLENEKKNPGQGILFSVREI